MYDLVIIGAGPAGLAAAVYAARQKIDFIVISKEIGGQTLLSSDVENYLGNHSITGGELVAKFREQIKINNVNVKKREKVTDLQKIDCGFNLITDKGEYETKTVLITAGKLPRKLGVPGETKSGVAYCATCDAPLFAEKDVAIIGGGNSAFDAALLLSKYVNKIYIIDIMDHFIAEKSMIDEVKANGKAEFFQEAGVIEILGEGKVEGIKLKVKGEEKTIDVQGVFVEIGYIPSVDFDKLTEKNRCKEIIIHDDKEKHIGNMTSVEGIFAAGDITDVPEKQIAVAAGEGVKAVLGIFKYLNKKPEAY